MVVLVVLFSLILTLILVPRFSAWLSWDDLIMVETACLAWLTYVTGASIKYEYFFLLQLSQLRMTVNFNTVKLL